MSKKIMFNDKFGLTQAVLDGRKTMTRRALTDRKLHYWKYSCPDMVIVKVPESNKIKPGDDNTYFGIKEKISDGYYCDTIVSPYKVGEVVAIAQSYSDCGNMPDFGLDEDGYPIMPKNSGFFNKMFVRANLMPHHIRITDVKVERLQDISNEDCLKEGVMFDDTIECYYYLEKGRQNGLSITAKSCFSELIDKVSSSGIWKSNPFVWVYEFELID